VNGVLFIGPEAGAHLALALKRGIDSYRSWCRANGVAERPEVSALFAMVAASSGPEETVRAAQPAVVEPVLVDARTAAARLSVSDRTVRRMTADGRLQSTRVGRRRLIPVAALDALPGSAR
jgi:excisionase family DNA binding protein